MNVKRGIVCQISDCLVLLSNVDFAIGLMRCAFAVWRGCLSARPQLRSESAIMECHNARYHGEYRKDYLARYVGEEVEQEFNERHLLFLWLAKFLVPRNALLFYPFRVWLWRVNYFNVFNIDNLHI